MGSWRHSGSGGFWTARSLGRTGAITVSNLRTKSLEWWTTRSVKQIFFIVRSWFSLKGVAASASVSSSLVQVVHKSMLMPDRLMVSRMHLCAFRMLCIGFVSGLDCWRCDGAFCHGGSERWWVFEQADIPSIKECEFQVWTAKEPSETFCSAEAAGGVKNAKKMCLCRYSRKTKIGGKWG